MNTLEKVIFTTLATCESHVSLDVMRERFAALAPAVAQQVIKETMLSLKLPEVLESHRGEIEQACASDFAAYFISKVDKACQVMKRAHTLQPC
ncbi:MAG TPA: hypothetical protein VN875_12025 [Candidatus Binatus sp.]|nr:hypothetical protein [Candidatus Binatus sp.]